MFYDQISKIFEESLRKYNNLFSEEILVNFNNRIKNQCINQINIIDGYIDKFTKSNLSEEEKKEFYSKKNIVLSLYVDSINIIKDIFKNSKKRNIEDMIADYRKNFVLVSQNFENLIKESGDDDG